MEVFRCECGRSFDIEMPGNEKSIECPNCKEAWLIQGSGGRYRISKWVD